MMVEIAGVTSDTSLYIVNHPIIKTQRTNTTKIRDRTVAARY